MLTTDDGAQLETIWSLPTEPHAALVLCHPHPQHGGTMNAPLIAALARLLTKEGWAVLRFNFRGVGGSSGSWGGGEAEVNDVAAAMRAAQARHPRLPIHLAGWSFGAATALRWQGAGGDTSPYVGIAPPVASELTPPLPAPGELAAAPRTLIIGDRDQFASVEELRAYAEAIGARLEVLKGSDHFFHFRDVRLAEIAVAALS